MRFLVIGPLAVETDGATRTVNGRREQVLLAGLLAYRNEVVPTTRLARFVWGGEGEPSRNALQARVSHLRRSLGLESDRLTYSGDGYRLRVDAGESDDEVLADAVGRAQALLGAGRGGAAEEVLAPALAAVRGEPYAPVSDHPVTLAAATRCRELVWSARELSARAALGAGDAPRAASLAATLVAEQPLRQQARVILMQALDTAGRRAEALACYEEGRRCLAAATGLEPSPVLRATYADILQTERAQTRAAAAGPGVLEPPEMIRWLADNDHLEAALRLAVRCAWGWWLAGERGRGRRLLGDLLDRAGDSPMMAPPATRAVRLWADALAGHEHDEVHALADADRVVAEDPDFAANPTRPGSEIEALALVLLADRRTERGEHMEAGRLLGPAQRVLHRSGDRWGVALGALVTARRYLLLGDTDQAEKVGREALREFHDRSDPAGQLGARDLLGYAAEVRGDWAASVDQHQRALLLAMHGGWPHAQCRQLTRLGSATVLAGQVESGRQRLAEALAVAGRLDSPSLLAFVRNSLASADARLGDIDSAAHGHRLALAWYRSAGSRSGIAFTSAALARVSPSRHAALLLGASWQAALTTRDPRALAFTAESRALVAGANHRGARHLGVADSLRIYANRPRIAGEQPAVDILTERVSQIPGIDAAYGAGVRTGQELAARLSGDAPMLDPTG